MVYNEFVFGLLYICVELIFGGSIVKFMNICECFFLVGCG